LPLLKFQPSYTKLYGVKTQKTVNLTFIFSRRTVLTLLRYLSYSSLVGKVPCLQLADSDATHRQPASRSILCNCTQQGRDRHRKHCRL